MQGCFLCEAIGRIRRGGDPQFVAELPGGFVRLHQYHYFRGYAFLIAKRHVSHMSELSERELRLFLRDMAILVRAAEIAFRPKIMNVAAMGNVVPHLHWHAVPRYGTDALPSRPPWNIEKSCREDPRWLASEDDLCELKGSLLQSLRDAGARIMPPKARRRGKAP